MVLSIVLLFWILGTALGVDKGTRIIGGNPANRGEFPFAVAIYVERAQSRLFCGGSILSEAWILTSAQCIDQAIQATIQIGSNNLDTGDADGNRISMVCQHFVIHPQFNSTNLQYDVGLIKLRLIIPFTAYIRRTSLPDAEVIDRSSVVALGWGQTDNDHPSPVDSLQYVQVAVVPQDECRRIFGSQLADHMLCVAGQSNEGPCFGDGGTPLVTYVSPTKHIQVGIWTFLSGNGCQSKDPSGYTRVYPFVSWIRNVTGILD